MSLISNKTQRNTAVSVTRWKSTTATALPTEETAKHLAKTSKTKTAGRFVLTQSTRAEQFDKHLRKLKINILRRIYDMLRARARSIPDKATRPIHQRVVTLFLEMLPSYVIWVLLKMEPIPEYHIFPSLFPFLVEHYSKSSSNCRQAKYESPWKRTLYPSSNKWYSFRYLYVYRTSVVLAVNHI